MIRKFSVLSVALAALLLASLSTGCRKLEARDNLNKGVQAFKNAKYADAVEFFKRSIELDPEFPTAKLYLATAYMSQWIPGADSPENVEYWKNAMASFQDVLKTQPNEKTAIESIASLYFQQSQGAGDPAKKKEMMKNAADWYKKLAEADPTNKVAYYSQGVIIWTNVYPERMAARNKLGMKPEEAAPLKDKKVREELKAKNLASIDEGIAMLTKSLEIDKEYDDAMAYLNLLHRERADLMDTPADAKTETAKADDWVAKNMEIRKIKSERAAKSAGGGIIQEGAAETK